MSVIQDYLSRVTWFAKRHPAVLRRWGAADSMRLLPAARSAETPPSGEQAAKREARRGQSAGGHVAEEDEQRPGSQDGQEGDEIRPAARRTRVGSGTCRVSWLPPGDPSTGGSFCGTVLTSAMPWLACPHGPPRGALERAGARTGNRGAELPFQ